MFQSAKIREYEGEERNERGGREIRVQKNIPCIEIDKFAINEKYLEWLGEKNYNNKKIGCFIFWKFISKTIVIVSEYMSFSFVILHAIRVDKVIQSYKTMGFETFEDDEMKIISLMDGVVSIKQEYVNDCKFMYLPVDIIFAKMLEGGM